MRLQLSLLQKINDFTNESLKCDNHLMTTIWEKTSFKKRKIIYFKRAREEIFSVFRLICVCSLLFNIEEQISFISR